MNSFNQLVIVIGDPVLKGKAPSGKNILLGLSIIKVNVVLGKKIGVI